MLPQLLVSSSLVYVLFVTCPLICSTAASDGRRSTYPVMSELKSARWGRSPASTKPYCYPIFPLDGFKMLWNSPTHFPFRKFHSYTIPSATMTHPGKREAVMKHYTAVWETFAICCTAWAVTSPQTAEATAIVPLFESFAAHTAFPLMFTFPGISVTLSSVWTSY